MTQIQKKILVKIILLILTLLLAYGISGGLDKVFAQSQIPEGIEIFHVEDRTFVRDVELGKLLYWCTNSCGECEEPVPLPAQTPHPTDIPPIPPTDVPPPPEPTPTDIPPEPTATPQSARVPCNRGGGNEAEGCDPGNSGGKPGNAGEGQDG